MSFISSLKLDAPLFNKSKRREAFRSVVRRAVKGFRRSLQEKMITGPHTGIIYDRGKARGDGFRRRHQASRRGERPSPDTHDLVDSIEDHMTGELTGTVEVTKPYLDKDGEEVLQGKLGRDIMTDDDRTEANDDLQQSARRALINLL